jgi:AraC-like DNA-binding protein
VASVILGQSLVDCWDRPIALSDLIGREADRLLDRIAAAPIASRGALMESWLISRLANWGNDHTRNLQLENALLWRFARESVSTLADDVGVTLRTLRRHCAKYAGLSPKQLTMSGRILRACAYLCDNRQIPVAEVALRAGFNDQAAFTNAFRYYVGITPTQLRSEPIVYCERPRD